MPKAFGAQIKEKKVGTFGDFGCFSFFPSKNLGAYGDGGLIISNNIEYAEKISMLRNHGSNRRYYHDIVGFNSRLDEIQAAILRVKLQHIDRFNHLRKNVATQYNSQIKNSGVTLPQLVIIMITCFINTRFSTTIEMNYNRTCTKMALVQLYTTQYPFTNRLFINRHK